MSIVTIPPKAPKCDSYYSRPVLERHPRMGGCAAGEIVADLWESHQPEGNIRVDKRWFCRTPEGYAARNYTFRIDANRNAELFVFHDFSCLIGEVHNKTLTIPPFTFRLNQTLKRHDEPKANGRIIRRSPNGFMRLVVHTMDTPWEEADLSAYTPGPLCPARNWASEIHRQMEAETLWWLENAPSTTPEKPSICVGFTKPGHQEIADLERIVTESVHIARALYPDEANADLLRSVVVHSPRPLLPDGRLKDFDLQLPHALHLPEEDRTKMQARLLKIIHTYPEINLETYAAQLVHIASQQSNILCIVKSPPSLSSHQQMELLARYKSLGQTA